MCAYMHDEGQESVIILLAGSGMAHQKSKTDKVQLARSAAGYARLLEDIKTRIMQAQTRAIHWANAELVRMYWDIGRMIDQRQRHEGWGTAVIPRLARDLNSELAEVKGFSERNINRMLSFYRAYPQPAQILPQVAA